MPGVGESEIRKQRIAQARAKWDAHMRRGKYYRKCSLTFDQLLKAFSSDCNSFKSIAQMSDPPVSWQCVQRLYKLYFETIFGRRGSKRRSLCAIKQRMQSEAAVKVRKNLSEPLRRVAIACEAHQLSWRPIRRGKGAQGFLTRFILIGGKRCRVQQCLASKTTSGHPYARFQVVAPREGEHQVVILVSRIPGWPVRIFVVPSDRPLEGRRCMYASESRREGKGTWLDQFEDKWHLLKPSIAGSSKGG